MENPPGDSFQDPNPIFSVLSPHIEYLTAMHFHRSFLSYISSFFFIQLNIGCSCNRKNVSSSEDFDLRFRMQVFLTRDKNRSRFFFFFTRGIFESALLMRTHKYTKELHGRAIMYIFPKRDRKCLSH